ncbi:MAG: ABC transporter permease [Chloroflexota bacterium]
MTRLKTPLRILAVVGKELIETIRRPGAIISTVLGPTVILGIFGLGFIGQGPLRAELVIPPATGLSTDPATYASMASNQVSIVGVVADEATADRDLEAGRTDIVVIAPADAQTRLTAGEQAILRVHYDTVSPYRALLARTAADRIASVVNQQVLERLAREAADRAAAAGQPLPASARPEVLSAPTRAEAINLAPTPPAVVPFYGLAVLALIIQHVGVTLGALSMQRDRRHGLIDLFRISPIRSGELLVGKYLAFGFLGAIIAAVTLGALLGLFSVPMLGDQRAIALTLGLLVLASTGLGILIALVSDSERQVVQLAMLLLLASVFFSGLSVDPGQFAPAIQAGAHFLPVTLASELLQDLLLRGTTDGTWRIGGLAAMAAGLFVLAWWQLRRTLAPVD